MERKLTAILSSQDPPYNNGKTMGANTPAFTLTAAPLQEVIACGEEYIWNAKEGQNMARAQKFDLDTVKEFARQCSNWGKWGAEDELGTINYITPEKEAPMDDQIRKRVEELWDREMIEELTYA